jgi:hypothetical protein
MKTQWVWVSLKILAVLVIFSHLYFEVALIIKLFIKPVLEASGDLNYHEGLGLFAPVIYMFEGGVKLLEGLSPVVKFVREILFAINSVLIIVSIVITRYVFKKTVWAGIVIVLLSVPSLILWFG